jgi:hypothetical protein
LDVKALVVRDTQFAFSITDAVPGERIVGVDHVGSLAGEIARVDGLVDDFQHADGGIGGVGVNALSHPLQEVGCSLVVCLGVEPWL